MSYNNPYFAGRSWSDISREERYFCAELYFTLSRMGSLKPFIALLNGQGEELDLPEDDLWQVGFEVCFYRDLIHAIGLDGTHGIRGKLNPTTGENYMAKRTFDLALFHPQHIVIVEAKSQQGLDRKQLASFARDEADIRALLSAMGQKVPAIHTVLLAQDRYVRSSRGLANEAPFRAAFSWQAVAEQATQWGADSHSTAALRRADQVR